MSNVIGLDLNVDNDFLAECVKQTVIMGISESLNGKNEVVSQLVKMVLGMKVDKNGKVSSCERENIYTLLEYHVMKAIKETAIDEIKTAVENAKPAISAKIREEIITSFESHREES